MEPFGRNFVAKEIVVQNIVSAPIASESNTMSEFEFGGSIKDMPEDQIPDIIIVDLRHNAARCAVLFYGGLVHIESPKMITQISDRLKNLNLEEPELVGFRIKRSHLERQAIIFYASLIYDEDSETAERLISIITAIELEIMFNESSSETTDSNHKNNGNDGQDIDTTGGS